MGLVLSVDPTTKPTKPILLNDKVSKVHVNDDDHRIEMSLIILIMCFFDSAVIVQD